MYDSKIIKVQGEDKKIFYGNVHGNLNHLEKYLCPYCKIAYRTITAFLQHCSHKHGISYTKGRIMAHEVNELGLDLYIKAHGDELKE